MARLLGAAAARVSVPISARNRRIRRPGARIATRIEREARCTAFAGAIRYLPALAPPAPKPSATGAVARAILTAAPPLEAEADLPRRTLS